MEILITHTCRLVEKPAEIKVKGKIKISKHLIPTGSPPLIFNKRDINKYFEI